MPNNWMDLVHDVKSLVELKVIEYVLRHTWGYVKQWGKSKPITLDEFEHGRKMKDGERMDRGIGMSRQAIRNGIKLAVDQGFLEVTEDRRDLGRIKRSFSLKMMGEENESSPLKNKSSQSKLLLSSPVENESSPLKKENSPRSEKDTIRKKRNKKNGSNKVAHTSTGFLISSFDKKAAGHLREVLVIHDADLVSPPRRVRIDTLAKSIFRLRTERKVDEDEIRTMIKWLKKEYSDTHTPDIHKADDLFSKWGKFRAARNRWLSDNGEVEVSKVEKDSESVANRVRNWLEQNDPDIDFLAGGFAEQSEVEEALSALGMEAGSINAEDL